MSPTVGCEHGLCLRPKAAFVCDSTGRQHAGPPMGFYFAVPVRHSLASRPAGAIPVIPAHLGGSACRRPSVANTDYAFGRRWHSFAIVPAGNMPALPCDFISPFLCGIRWRHDRPARYPCAIGRVGVSPTVGCEHGLCLRPKAAFVTRPMPRMNRTNYGRRTHHRFDQRTARTYSREPMLPETLLTLGCMAYPTCHR